MTVEEALRRTRNLIVFGITAGQVTTGADGVPRVQVKLNSLEAPFLKISEQRGVASNLPVGTPVVCAFHNGDHSNGAVIASTAPGERPAMSGDSDRALYAYGFIVRIAADGVHIDAPKVFMTGDLEVKGEVTAKVGGGASVTLSGHLGHNGGGQKPTAGT